MLAVANSCSLPQAGEVIRSMLEVKEGIYVIVVEHDLAVLDYLSDYICCLYGIPGGYGVVTMPFSVREGINIFLAGFVPTENLRFRDVELTFKVAQTMEEAENESARARFTYPSMRKVLQSKKKKSKFILNVEGGEFADAQIIILLGENGTGKTTLIRMLAGLIKPDPYEDGTMPDLEGFRISYKPQKISPKSTDTVKGLLYVSREAVA